MVFDGIFLRKIVAELHTALIGGKVNKVFAPTKNEILLSIYSHGIQYALLASISADHYHLNLTTTSKPNPLKASNFCMLLRKHLIGFCITDIQMYGLERIVWIHFSGYNEMNDPIQKILVIELMGKHSNLLLLSEKGIIIDSLRHLDTESGSTRNLLPAHPYEMPPNTKTDFLSFSDEYTFLQYFEPFSNEKLENVLPSHLVGISKNYVETILAKQEQEKTKKETLCFFYHTLQKELSDLQALQKSETPILTANFACDDFYSQKEKQQLYDSFRLSLVRLVSEDLKKVRKKLEHMEEKLEECKEMQTYQLYGELLTTNLYQFQNTKEHLPQVTLLNYYENNTPIDIPLDVRFSPAENAKRYFKKYTKLKNTLEIVSKQKRQTLQELDYLGSILYELESASTLEDLHTIYEEISKNLVSHSCKLATSQYTVKENKPSRFLTFEIDGYSVFVGKNNLQNDELTLKIAKKTDYWFHTKEIHGSHVILKVDSGKPEPSMQTFIQCAKLAAKYSKAKYSSSVPVDYTQVKYVKKPSGAKPGMVIYTNYKTIHVTNEL